MPFRSAPSVWSSLVLGLWGTTALAQGAEPTPETPPGERLPAARTEVVVGVRGRIDPEARTTLGRLLRAELEPQGLTLVEADPSGEARDWAREMTKGESRLLAALLETEGSSGWRLVVIDPARGRAISRELPRGERDLANVEAIVSIVLSAARALREGLEVASAPLEAVVDPRAQTAPPAPSRAQEPAPTPQKPAPASGTSLYARIGAIGASFAEEAEPTFGGSLALGASIASYFDVDLAYALHLPVTVESSFGSFELAHDSLTLFGGPVFRGQSFALVPALGATVEWIRRSETTAVAGVAEGGDSETTPRFGGVLALRGRLRLFSRDSAELVSLFAGASASYFGERVRFLAGDEVLAEARRSAFAAELGLFITTGPL
jgi:hypothetical protein